MLLPYCRNQKYQTFITINLIRQLGNWQIWRSIYIEYCTQRIHNHERTWEKNTCTRIHHIWSAAYMSAGGLCKVVIEMTPDRYCESTTTAHAFYPNAAITRPVSLSLALYLLLKCRMNWNFCERILFYMWNHLLSELSTYLRWALLFAITKSVHVWWVDVSKATVSSIKKAPRILSEDNKNTVDLTLCWKNKALENPFFRVNGAK